MKRPPREDVCARIEAVGVVPVVRAPSPELAMRAAEAVLAGGISIFEITMTVPDGTKKTFHNIRLFVKFDGQWKLLGWANEDWVPPPAPPGPA